MTESQTDRATVPGERGDPLITKSPAASSRLSSALAIALMSVLGIGSLTWYYATTLARQGQGRKAAQELATSRAQGDLPLPSLGPISPPKAVEPVSAPPAPPEATPSHGQALTEAALTLADPQAPGLQAPKSQAQINLERRLGGAAFSGQPSGATPTVVTAPGSGLVPPPGRETSELGALLRPTLSQAVRAEMLPSLRMLLPKGAFIDCTLETAIDSTLPGMTTCVTATDTFGADGKVVLLERGTKLVGETRGQVQQGAARVFVIWDEARTPTGVVVPLASPGADELGRSGLSGTVNRHFLERFGAAMLISVIDGAVQAAVQGSGSRGGAVIVNPSGSESVITEVLKSTVNTPPTIQKSQGDRIQILVARDLDFRSVYTLRTADMEP